MYRFCCSLLFNIVRSTACLFDCLYFCLFFSGVGHDVIYEGFNYVTICFCGLFCSFDSVDSAVCSFVL